jgi:hypothetical protein
MVEALVWIGAIICLFIYLGNKWRNPLHKESKRKQLYLYMGRLYSYCQKGLKETMVSTK